MRDGKTTEIDVIAVELIKTTVGDIKVFLLKIINKVWMKGKQPHAWVKQIICRVFRTKRHIRNCEKYRGII